jgi:hypothetical protein
MKDDVSTLTEAFLNQKRINVRVWGRVDRLHGQERKKNISIYTKGEQTRKRLLGKGKYRSEDNIKIGIKRGSSY